MTEDKKEIKYLCTNDNFENFDNFECNCKVTIPKDIY